MGRVGSGVEARASSIRIVLTAGGYAIRERVTVNGVPLPPTPANLKHAHRLAADIRRAIAQGRYNHLDYFPDSKAQLAQGQTFGQVVQAWLQSKGHLAPATRSQYRNATRVWLELLGERTPMDALTYQVLAARIGSHPWASGKLANNYLIALRGAFAFHYAGPRAALDPMAGIKNLATVKPEIDPFTPAERDAALAELLRRHGPQVWAYFQFAFFTGMRPEEVIALRWGDIDQATGTARVQRVRTFKGSERAGSKTHKIRDVALVPQARAAIRAMAPFSALAGVEVFLHPRTGRPWHDERAQRDTFLKPVLRQLGIRARPAYNTRHTFATVALMAGVPPAYIAQQLGHSTTKMLHERYAKWIDQADQGAARERLAAAFSPQILPSASSSQK